VRDGLKIDANPRSNQRERHRRKRPTECKEETRRDETRVYWTSLPPSGSGRQSVLNLERVKGVVRELQVAVVVLQKGLGLFDRTVTAFARPGTGTGGRDWDQDSDWGWDLNRERP
jgi:hypothetical protein